MGVQNVRYVYEYDGKREDNVTTASAYTYTKPGIYTVLQLGEYKGLPLRACAIVWAYDTLPPAVAMTACGNQLKLFINDILTDPGKYDYVLIRWGDGQTDTLRKGQTEREHVFAGNAARQIQVQGIHEVGNCGGTKRLTFTPNQPAQIRLVEPAGLATVRIQVDNPAALPLRLEQRVDKGAFSGGQPVPEGTMVSLEIQADTSVLTCYRLVPAGNCPGTAPSPEVCHTFPPTKSLPNLSDEVYFPDAFSPNNDGLNDTFGPVNQVSSLRYQLTVFDRWGRVVFNTDNQKRSWNGDTNGVPAPIGVYGYQAQIERPTGKVSQTSGKLQLVR
ncbi:hypothetical protein GCM10027577_44740 [Spirosoma fluminis]